MKDAPSIKELREGATETLKRPLTGLFRRPGSRAGKKKEEEEAAAESASALPPSNFRTSTKLTSALEDVVLNDESPRSGKSESVGSSVSRNPVTKEAANAPNFRPSLKEEIVSSKLADLFKLDDIDLSILGRHFPPENELYEDNAPWDWDHLYASLSSELRDEWSSDSEN
ncbi:unnamed protein product [Caenorhabditis bovis]|uniref:Intraflagellar transport protein 43 homolog n=1 Tax=Caenorhabditis bovis TaxID=2654633 RepID=A0A8S1FCZ6_9PELO|nr:unnamed protein product [Caenorhabditis bovis]